MTEQEYQEKKGVILRETFHRHGISGCEVVERVGTYDSYLRDSIKENSPIKEGGQMREEKSCESCDFYIKPEKGLCRACSSTDGIDNFGYLEYWKPKKPEQSKEDNLNLIAEDNKQDDIDGQIDRVIMASKQEGIRQGIEKAKEIVEKEKKQWLEEQKLRQITGSDLFEGIDIITKAIDSAIGEK
jgi:RNA polymerase subunit RPABC4/transcription elongation factor Spt4